MSDRIQKLIKATHLILPYARTAFRKPATIGCILFTAHRAQITLGVLLVFLIFLAPTIVDFVAGIIFPAETSKKVFGLIKMQQENPAAGYFQIVIMVALWLSSIISTLLLCWFHIPAGLSLANARARNLLTAGESTIDMIKRRALYVKALALATDPNLESEIKNLLIENIPEAKIASSTRAVATGEAGSHSNTVVDSFAPAQKSNCSSSKLGLAERYDLGEQLGSGAMGVVFSAWDKVLGRKVAVKQLSMILAGDDEYIFRFRREAQALARLNHPNVVQVYDLIEEGNRLWMVVEYVDGGDLSSYLNKSGRLSVCEAVNIIVPIAEGLAFTHDQGIVHRDLKPANILLTAEQTPKITDFGIAKLSQASELTQAGSVLGSPSYMSPEQCSGGSVDSRTDIYALGITLYELLTGKKPFEGDTSSVLARQIVEKPAPLSEHIEDIPHELEDLVLQMLAKNPDERPTDLSAVVDLLSPFRVEVTCSK